MNLKEIHNLCVRNKDLIKQSTDVGCFYCCKIFPANDVVTFVNSNGTAMCPHCMIDSILPDASVELTDELLQEMYNKYFSIENAKRRLRRKARKQS